MQQQIITEKDFEYR